MSIRRKASSFEEYWLASKAWERHGLTAAAAGSLVHNGFFTVDDLQGAHDLELATIPGIGGKSLSALRWAVAIGFHRHLAATLKPSGPEIRHRTRGACLGRQHAPHACTGAFVANLHGTSSCSCAMCRATWRPIRSNSPIITACTTMSSTMPGMEGAAPARMIGIAFQSRLTTAPTKKPMRKNTGLRDMPGL